ncbi:hypothetical protein T492DRAFT_878124 [Pavlovales sp. CCMP2436]|nr:hypothetical protein T492DRAFT_878124 [Pavlovales sp. CCMP2436]
MRTLAGAALLLAASLDARAVRLSTTLNSNDLPIDTAVSNASLAAGVAFVPGSGLWAERIVGAGTYDGITPEWDCKLGALRPSAGDEPHWAGCDAVVRWAVAHKLAVHGHTLVWNSRQWTPAWVDHLSAESRAALVNEPLADIGDAPYTLIVAAAAALAAAALFLLCAVVAAARVEPLSTN